MPSAGIPFWVRPQGAQALQHAGQRPWSPLSGPPCGRGGGWEITYSAVPLALGRSGQWPGGAGAGAMQPFIAPLSSNWCFPPARAAASGAPGSASQRYWPELASAGRAGVLPSHSRSFCPCQRRTSKRRQQPEAQKKKKERVRGPIKAILVPNQPTCK